MSTWSESFNKTDSTTLGPDQTWTESHGDLQVVNNACRAVSTATMSMAGFSGPTFSIKTNSGPIKMIIYMGGV